MSDIDKEFKEHVEERQRSETNGDPTNGRRSATAIYVLLAIAAVTLGGGGTFAWLQGRHVNNALCRAQVNNRQSMRGLLALSQRIALENAYTQAERDRVRGNYSRLFVLIPRLECENGKPVEVDRGR